MLFAPGGDPQPVVWHKAKEGQPWAPEGNVFVSGNWVARDLSEGELGEQPGPKPWRNGKDVKDYPVQIADGCSLDTKLVEGLSTSETTGPWDGKGLLGCCDTCVSLPDDLLATFEDLGDCGSIDGTAAMTREPGPGPCNWEGLKTVGIHAYVFVLDKHPGPWTLTMHCLTDDTVFTLVSVQFSPFEIVFTAHDLGGCCHSGSPIGDFKVTITE